MSVQAKRLFVGGLNSGTNEKDLRERFKTFGSVSSVEVHVRPKSEGFPEKTFAYVELDASDLNIKKCITMLSNTRWKGGILKIQVAKESFLSRLQREREEIKSKGDIKNSKSSPTSSELTIAAPNSLPGTLIPGKKNWVVGKFGRVLPVVHMRQTGSHKISRIDPSKTLHNLKRIKDDACDDKTISELTWSLGKENDDEVIINGDKHEEDSDDTDSSSEDFCGESKSAPKSKKKKMNSQRNKIENLDESEKMESFKEKNSKKDSPLKKYYTVEKISVNGEGLENRELEKGESSLDDNDNVIKDDSLGNIESAEENIKSLAPVKSKKKKSKKKRRASDSSDSDQVHSIPHGSSDETVVKKKPKNKVKKEDQRIDSEENSFENSEDKSILLDSKRDLKNTQNDDEKHEDLKITLDEKMNKKKEKKERKKEKKSKDGMTSENKSTTNELEVSKKKKREKESKQSYEEVKIVESIGESNNNRKKKPAKIKEENPAKKLASNEKRLRAAKEREASSMSKQSIIASALKNLDGNDENVKNSKHIKFDEEYEEEEQVVGEKEGKTKGKISGSKAANWLGLHSASDDDEDFPDKEVEKHLFAAKPQFEGETGQKLFKLQKSYRGDSRFQLDERFAESDDEPLPQEENDRRKPSVIYASDSDVEATIDDDISKQLSREKDLSMSVLRGILGHNIGTKYGDNTSKKDRFTDSSLIRYDPTRDDHAQFEQKLKKQDDRPEPAVNKGQQETTEVMRSVPEVTSDKFYDVKTSALSEVFGKNKSDDNTTSFKFLSDQDITENTEALSSNWGATEELRSKPWNPVMLPYDSSGDEEEDMEHEEEQERVQTAPEESFFFHFGDPELERRVDDEESLFMRTQSLDQLNEQWIANRSDLTQDYKKKHKDALKRQSKMAAKRARMR